MKLNADYFYCFGCGATGDVIDFVVRLFGLSSYEVAKKLARDFGLGLDKPPVAAALKKLEYPLAKSFRRDGLYCQRVFCDYLHLLVDWKERYSPARPERIGVPSETDCFAGERRSSGASELSCLYGSEGCTACDDVDDRFVEACQMLDYVEHLLDVLMFAMIFSADTKSSTQMGLSLRPMAASEQDRIHLANGTLELNGSFTEGRPEIVRRRLPVTFRPNAPRP